VPADKCGFALYEYLRQNRKLDLIVTDIVRSIVQRLIFNNKHEEKINGFRNRLAEGRHSET
jgi:hypothetical protein